MNLSAFKTYDIRGPYPDEVNEELAFLVGRALVRHLSAKNIVVGYDMRTSSESLRDKLIEGITCEGADVINIGRCTTPMLYYAVAHYGYDGGVMISASHNPASHNGFKLVKKGAQMVAEGFGLEDIKEIVKKGFGQCSVPGVVTEKNVLTEYLGHHLRFAEGISDISVVVDYSNGVGSISGKPLFARLNLDLTEMYEEPDGNFPNHPANPHDIENFKDLRDMVVKKKATVGIFFDGDADRAIAVDELGSVVPMDLMTVLLAKEELKKKKKGTVYFDLRFSKAVPDLIKSFGGDTKMLRVGNPFYKQALREHGGILASEFSGHIMYPENYDIDDGLFVAIKILKLVSESKKPLSEMIKEVNKYETTEEITFKAKNPNTVFDRLYAEFPEAKRLDLDGVYLDFPDGFISVRESQNEPGLFRIRAEARTKEELARRFEKAQEIVKS